MPRATPKRVGDPRRSVADEGWSDELIVIGGAI